MRDLRLLDAYRLDVTDLYGWNGDSGNGAFRINSTSQPGQHLAVIASSGRGWDHVSVSLHNRTPTWAEMEQIKRMFFGSDEVAMQLHVAESEHISYHPHTLHIWRPHDLEIPMPPPDMVGPRKEKPK